MLSTSLQGATVPGSGEDKEATSIRRLIAWKTLTQPLINPWRHNRSQCQCLLNYKVLVEHRRRILMDPVWCGRIMGRLSQLWATMWMVWTISQWSIIPLRASETNFSSNSVRSLTRIMCPSTSIFSKTDLYSVLFTPNV